MYMRKKFFFSPQKMYKNVNKIVLTHHGDEFFKVDECSREIFKNKKKEKGEQIHRNNNNFIILITLVY